MYKTIDLFAGAGGMSLGFKQTGKYEIVAAYENNANAQNTYKKNHTETLVYSDVCLADFKDLQKKLGKIDVVIGGPPCQGFSSANRQKNHIISQNNMLVKQYVRAVTELDPKAFVMENVEMLRSDVHRFYLREDEHEMISKYEIETCNSEILLLEGKFCSDEVAEDVKDINIVNSKLWTEKDYKLLNIVYRQRNNLEKCKAALLRYKNQLIKLSKRILGNENTGEYECFNDAANAINMFFDDKIQVNQVVKCIEKAIMLQRCLSRAKEIFDNELTIDGYTFENGLFVKVQSYSVFDYITKVLGAEKNGYVFNQDVLNAVKFGVPQKRNRFILIGIKKDIANEVNMPKGTFDEKKYRTVEDAIKDLEKVNPVYEISEDCGTLMPKRFKRTDLTDALRDSDKLYNHVITKTREVAMARFKAITEGENFHFLDSALKVNTYTDASRTQNTIYQRLKYKSQSGTVLNVRKSMWIHPKLNRAVSIREAARLQTFPDSFVFCGTKDSQYQQVGNAVPPMLAKAIAEHLAEYLDGDNNG